MVNVMKNNISSLSDIYNLVVENYVREYNISASAKELWLDALEPISMEGNVVTLATDTDFKRNTINSIYLEKLEEQFTIVLGNPIKVEIIIKDDIPTTETKFNDIRNSRELTNKIDNIVHDNKVTYTFDNFIVGPSNNLAYAAAKAVSQKQHEKYNPLFIYGDSGLGKTHLLSAIQNEMTKNYPGINIIYISAETFTNEFLHSITANKTELFDEKYRNADALLIDDIQFIAGKEQTEEKFFHILIIEDNSPDGTATIVRKLQTEFPDRLFMIERKGKLGLGTAYIAGFKWAIEHQYDFVFEMDADFSHNPNDLPRLYNKCAVEGYDVAIGSRYVSGVNVVNWPMGRVLMSYFASKYVRIITGLPIHDTTAGFKCYRREVLETIGLDGIRFKGYAFQIEMKFTAYKCGFKIAEVPVIFVNRELGTSKMNGSIFGEAVLGVIQLKLGSWFRKYPQKKTV